MSDAPSCPTSFGQPVPGARVFLKGEPWSRPGTLHDLVNKIPRAHDLPSAIHALNQIKNIITMINRGEPVVNNTRFPKEPDVSLKGEDFKPNYGPSDWTQGPKDFVKQKLINPDDDSQYIELDTVKEVGFYNANSDTGLQYSSKVA
jgi:hypothetical protein